ncbi:MAG: hypothetical protein Q7K35_02940 [bacterium]|nr:hypothetical protein [bacterium]
MAKSLDGIKKLSPDDIKKYRRIVLNYIGEKDSTEVSEQNDSKPEASSPRMVDGVNLNKINRFASKEKGKFEKAPAQGDQKAVSGRNQEELIKSGEEERLREAIKRQEEGRKKIKEEERQYQINKEQEERNRLEQEERQRQEKIRLEEERIRQEKNKEKERQRAEETKKLVEKKKSEDLIKEEQKKAKEKIRLESEKIEKEKAKQLEIIKQKRELAEKKFREERELIKQEELKKKEIVEQAKRQAQEKKRAEGIKRYEERIRLEKLKEEENRRIRENFRLERMRRREEIKRLRLEMKIKRQAEREKRRIKRRRAWKKMKKNFNFKLRILLLRLKQNIIYIVSFLAVSLAIIYIVFCLAVLRFNNGFIGWAANYLSVPAVITNQGIVSYSDYRKIEDENYLRLSLAEKKNYLSEWVVLRNLRNKYRISTESSDNNLAIRYVLDKDFNQVGLSRINKINELLKGGSEFESLGRYADEYSDGAYYDSASATEKFGSKGLGLVIGQTSQIIPQANGYYLVERIDDKNGQLGLRYLFIEAKTLDQYVHEKLNKTGVFILAD